MAERGILYSISQQNSAEHSTLLLRCEEN